MAIKLSRTPSSAGNQKIFTFSTWYKRSFLALGSGATSLLTAYYGNSSRYTQIVFDLDDNLEVFGGVYTTTAPAAYNIDVVTKMKFRDTNSWYHIVVAVDTTQATDTDRVKIWVNGVLQAVEGNYGSIIYPTQNSDTFVNSTIASHYLCENGQDNRGYMAHTHLIDGTAYAATDFGQFNSNGVWIPKTSPSVTYGTNGFFMKYENSSNFGTDSSVNGNTLSVTGTPTQTLDTPSNVFATLNPKSQSNSNVTFANGNLTQTTSGSWLGALTTLGAKNGKWYAEYKATDIENFGVGIVKLVNSNTSNYMNSAGNPSIPGYYADSWGITDNWGTVNFKHDNTDTAAGITFTNGDIVMIAMDLDNNKVWFGQNGTWLNSGDPANGTNAIYSNVTADEPIGFMSTCENANGTWNFGNGYFGTTAVASGNADGNSQGVFEYSVPTGFYALCTKNLATYG
jgi:hypothetical protein